MLKSKKLWFMVFALMCFIGIGVCIIVNIAMVGTTTWSAIPTLSIIFGWLVAAPLFHNRNQVVLSLASLTVFSLPFLFLLARETPGESWFYSLGFVLGIVGLVLIWITYCLFRFVKLSMWYKSAAAVILITVIASPSIHKIIESYTLEKPALPNDHINIISGIVAAALLFIIGYVRADSSN